MEEAQTWRELLFKLISVPQERQRIASRMGVNQLTLTRWATNRSSPRQENLVPLLDSLPQYRYVLVDLIKKEFPNFFSQSNERSEVLLEIPSAFYSRVFAALASSVPILRTQSICTLILQQLLVQLDPHRLGMAAIISQCVPPREGQKVHSLREVLQRSTLHWENAPENRTQLLGTESLAGYALVSGHAITIRNREEKLRMFPTHHRAWEESAFASPILLANSTAGCLYLSSTQQDHFSQEAKKLILEYVDLLVMAFVDDEFYNLQDIDLGLMPPGPVQQALIASFQQRVTDCMIEKARNQEPIPRRMAETMVWQELEDRLRQLGSLSKKPS
ncbi:MAG TPA: hypothetical protein VFB12_14555 [Ktedonobacteraceae bacterium]|nr:hypothetical protein [Ktedonobacteraceae bacterium]